MAARTAQSSDRGPDRDSLQALGKLATVVDGRLRIVSDPPFVVPVEELFPQDVESDELRDSFHKGFCAATDSSLQSDRRHLLEGLESYRSPARWWG